MGTQAPVADSSRQARGLPRAVLPAFSPGEVAARTLDRREQVRQRLLLRGVGRCPAVAAQPRYDSPESTKRATALLLARRHPRGRRGPELLDRMQRESIVAVGWSELGDLTAPLANDGFKDVIRERLVEASPAAPAVIGRGAQQLSNFCKRMGDGDYVLACDGATVLGIGRITGPYHGIVRLIRLDPKNLQSRTIRLPVDATRPGRRLGLV